MHSDIKKTYVSFGISKMFKFQQNDILEREVRVSSSNKNL